MPGQAVRRSWLLLPATQKDEIERSWTVGADVVVLDLEDLVHDSRKHEARANIRNGIEQARRGGAEVFVRCDMELLYADLEASVWRGLQGVILPKVACVEQVHEAAETLDYWENQHGVMQAGLVGEVNEYDEPRTIDNALELHLMLENAKGQYDAERLAGANPRVKSMSLGRADLVMDLRPEPNGELHLMRYLSQRLITVACACGVVPIGAWWQGSSRGMLASPPDTLEAARLGRQAGFRGGLCVRPEQVASMNQGFTPTVDEVRSAEQTVSAFASARGAGKPHGSVDGVLVDAASAACAQQLLDLAAACTARDQFKIKAEDRARAAA